MSSRTLQTLARHTLVALAIAGCGTQSFSDGPLAADAGESADAQDTVALPDGCGDGILAADEECDDGNDDDMDACFDCKIAVCGDGMLFEFQETCDDGNSKGGDGCSADCAIEEPQCTTGELPEMQDVCNGLDDNCNGFIDGEYCLVQIYRYYNSTTQDSKYGSASTAPQGFVMDSQSLWIYAEEVPNSVPLYQKLGASGSDHLLTLNVDEGNDVGFTVESILGYVVKETDYVPWRVGAGDPVKQCRYFNLEESDHVVDRQSEEDEYQARGYKREGCGFWTWDSES